MYAKTRTIEDVRTWFYRHGVTVAEWSRIHGFSPNVVAAVIAGRSKANRGQGHQVAVALGLKLGHSEYEPSPLDFKNVQEETNQSNYQEKQIGINL